MSDKPKRRDLKCCGNCYYLQADKNYCLHSEDKEEMHPWNLCDDWSYDGLLQSSRKAAHE